MQQILLRKHLNPQQSNSICNTKSLKINALESLLTNKQHKKPNKPVKFCRLFLIFFGRVLFI